VIVNFFDELSRWVLRSGELWLGILAATTALVLLFYKGPRPILAAAGVLAIVGVFGAWFGRHQSIEPELAHLLFGLFAVMAIAAAVLMLIQRHPVYSALYFALVVLASAGLFVLGSAPFLAAAIVIVYAGAIIVTFLFVVMLAQQSGAAVYDHRFWSPLPASVASAVLVGTILSVVNDVYARPSSAEAVVKRLEQLEHELTPADVQVTKAVEPKLLGKSFAELLVHDLDDVGGAEGEQLKRTLADADKAWKTAWAGKPQLENVPASIEPIPEPVAEPTRVHLDAGRQQSQLLLATKMMLFAGRRIQAARGVHPTIAAPPPSDALRINMERSRLSTPNLDDRSMTRALGRSLWGDYLLAVELAGTLLLVAAVGAVAVNMRRKEASL
jgi:NADH:ubiquinone oxidoreductase subunit 6 (subunit J)